MGLGGYLMWTAAAREISTHLGVKCLPIESHGSTIKMINSPIFYNNPSFIQPGEKFDHAFPLILNNPSTNYCKNDTSEKATHRFDKHVISQICESYGIQSPNLKCEIFLDEREKIFIDDFLLTLGLSEQGYIVIEPHTKDEYTVNKRYPFDKWQHVVNKISPHIRVIQVGQKTENILKGCVDMTGSTTFREAAGIISHSLTFVGGEGGLMHASNAVGTKSVILVTGYHHPRMTCYPENKNIWIGKDHGPCGLKIECSECTRECNEHDPEEIVRLLREILKI